jgi:hypothetical protein
MLSLGESSRIGLLAKHGIELFIADKDSLGRFELDSIGQIDVICDGLYSMIFQNCTML